MSCNARLLFPSAARARQLSALVLSLLALGLVRPASTAAPVNQDWVAHYAGPGNGPADTATALAVDPSGNVYVTGWSASDSRFLDYATVKYSSSGAELWVRRYDAGNGHDDALAIAVDGNGNTYVTGESAGSGTGYDYATVKYAPDGTELWVRRYNGPGNGDDIARALAVDGSGNIYVTGSAVGSGGENDYVTVKYDTNGTELWVRSYDGPEHNVDNARALSVDGSGNVYVTGESRSGTPSRDDYATIKYSPIGTELWVRRYNGPADSWDSATALTLDPGGNVYVTGASVGSGGSYDYATVKYDASGSERWVARYNGPSNQSDGARAVAVDGSGNVLVTGFTGSGGPSSFDYATVKYNASGTELWSRIYSSPPNDWDSAEALAVDGSGNVYVTGESQKAGYGDLDAATIKYDPNGNVLWLQRYDGPGNTHDKGLALALDGSGNVYVAGGSASNTASAYTTLKYSQTPPDVTAPALSNLGSGTTGASNGLAYVRILATDDGSGVLKVELGANSSNCHLEYPLGTRVVPAGTARPHTLTLANPLASVTVYVVKDSNAAARAEMRAWDAVGNTSLMDPVVADLHIRQGRRLSRAFTGIPASEHFVTLENGTPGLTSAVLWVNGKVVFRGDLTDGEVVSLDTVAVMRPKRNSVRITAAGPRTASAVLTISDAPNARSTGGRPAIPAGRTGHRSAGSFVASRLPNTRASAEPHNRDPSAGSARSTKTWWRRSGTSAIGSTSDRHPRCAEASAGVIAPEIPPGPADHHDCERY